MRQEGLQPTSGIERMFRVKRRGMTAKGCMVSAAIFFMLLLVAGGLATYFVVKNFRGWVAAGSEAIITEVINDANIPESEKDEVKAIVSDLRTDFENEVISTEDFGLIIQGFTTSPLIPAVIASESYRSYYEVNPDLTDEDKAAAKLELGRMARGIFEESITNGEVITVLDPITVPEGTAGGTVKMNLGGVEITLKKPEQCSIEELNLVTANARAASDAQKIPDEAFEVDLSDELEKIINQALGRDTDVLNTAPPPPPPSVDETYQGSVGETPADPSDPEADPEAEPVVDDGP